MIAFDEAELEGLVDFLRDCPGRISAAVVPGPSTGDELIERLRGALPDLTFEVVGPSLTPGEVGERARELGRSEGNVLVVRLDGGHRLDSEEKAVELWRGLNYQRERLSSGAVRTCIFLDREGNDRLALMADDLYEWVTFFRFPAVVVPQDALGPSESRFQILERPGDGGPWDLDVLRDQWRRARETGLPEHELVWNYTRPLFVALVRARRFTEASRLWKHDLRDGDALSALPAERRVDLLFESVELARHEGFDRFLSRARDYVDTAEGMLKGWKSRVSDDTPESTVSNFAETLFNLGKIQSDLGEREAAQKSYEEALDICRHLAAQQPAAFEPNVAMTLNNLGNVQRDLGEREAAQKSFEEALEIYRRLAAHQPAGFEPDIAMTLNNFGTVQGDLGEREAAQKSFEAALEIYRRLAAHQPAAFEPDVATALNNLGNVQSALDEREAAQKSYEEALEIRRRLAAQHPAAFGANIAGTLNNLGKVQSALGEREAAQKSYEEALEIYLPLAKRHPKSFLQNLMNALEGYTSVVPETDDDPWWRLWNELTRAANKELAGWQG